MANRYLTLDKEKSGKHGGSFLRGGCSADEVLWVVSPEVGKLFSDTSGLRPQVSAGDNMPVDISVYLQHSHHHHALGSRKAAPALAGTPVAGLLVVHIFTSVGCPYFYISQAGNSMALTTGENVPWDFAKPAQKGKVSAGGSNFSALNCRLYPCSSMFLFSSLAGSPLFLILALIGIAAISLARDSQGVYSLACQSFQGLMGPSIALFSAGFSLNSTDHRIAG